MATKMIGLEVGSSTLKLVLCKDGVVKTLASKRMPDDLVREGRITSAPVFVSFLKNMRKEFHIPSGPCALILPGRTVIAHHVLMSPMAEDQLLLNLPYEFRDYVGKDGGKYDYDYSVMSLKADTMEIYAAAVRKDVVEWYREQLKKAGLRLKIATPEEMAWMNLVGLAKDPPKKLCILDIGQNVTKVFIFSEGNFALGKTIEIGGLTLDQAIAGNQDVDAHEACARKEANRDNTLDLPCCVEVYQTLAIEVMKTVNFYSYSNSTDDSRLETIYYCGGSSCIEPLRIALQKATEMILHPISDLLPSDVDTDSILRCAVAAGAAVQKR